MEKKEKLVVRKYLACLLAVSLLVGLVGFGIQPLESGATAYGSFRFDIATVPNNTVNGLDRGTYDDVYIRMYSGNDATGTLIYQSPDLGSGKTNGGNSGSLSVTDVPTSSAIKSIQIIKPSGTDDWGCDYWKVYYIPAGASAIYICGEDPDQWKCGDGGYRTINVTWFQDHNRSITFDGNGATTGSTPTQYLVYGTADLLNTNGFLRLGYTFAGWATTSGGAVAYAQNASFLMPDSNQTLYAKWTPNTYSVKYNGNGNTGGSMSNSTHTYDVPKNLTANAFTKTGYTFSGWQDEAEATYADAQSVVNLTPENNREFNLFAQWTANTYYMVFNGNGATGGSMPNQAVTYNTTVNLTPNAFVRTGYSFIGWATSAEGPVVYNDFQSINNLTTVAGAQIQLYAKWVAHNYTVAYNGNGATGGSTANSSHVYDVAKNLTLNGYARTGYTFLGWATVPGGAAVYQNGENVVNLTPVDNATFTLYAVWSANNYLITFNANGGEGGTSSYMTYGAPLTAPIVTRTGYAFTGWTPGVPATVPAANSTYTANWILKSYTITFNANGGTGGYTQTMPYGSELVAPTVTREGYYFVGWLPEVPGTVPAANTTYVAQWSSTAFTITFDAAGGTGSAVYTLPEGVPLTPPVVTRTGYTFAGWNPAVPPTSPGANTTYYAMWTKNIYTIIFDAAGGNGSAAYDLEYGAPLTAPAVTREGYTFAGWNPNMPPTVPAANTTYTAQWTVNTYYLTYDPEGGTVSPAGKTVTFGTAYGALPTPTRTGYTFLGWYNGDNGTGEQITTISVVSTPSDHTIYAKWQINSYTIGFFENGGSTVPSITQNYNTQVAKPADPTKTGYLFAEWYYDIGLTNMVTWPYTMGASNVHFYAKWTPITYTVTFNGNGATAGSTANKAFTYDDIARPLNPNGFTREGYHFTGWTTTPGGSVEYYDEQPVRNLTAQAGATINLYAVWAPNSYTVTFSAAGGEGGTSGQMFYGDPLIPPTVTQTGYTFTG
ncbi:MAG TPA: InlB B-repeat-containing protein, partial [Clostridiales bacterium]|nr:InlB B-repeat-containing protein [Clostridiales bacterium]